MDFVGKDLVFSLDGARRRVELFTKENGVLPFSYFAELTGVKLAELMQIDKRDLRGLILNAKYVNDDGIKCLQDGTLAETEGFQEVFPHETWDQFFWINGDGAILTESELSDLPTQQQGGYRKVRCIKVTFANAWFRGNQIYIGEDATAILAELLMMDVVNGDPIRERYRYECKRDQTFANKYGLALELGIRELRERQGQPIIVCSMPSIFIPCQEEYGAIKGTKPNTVKEARIECSGDNLQPEEEG